MSAVRKASAKLILLQNRDFLVIIYIVRFPLVLSSFLIGSITLLQSHGTTSLGPQGLTLTSNSNKFVSGKCCFVPLRDLSTDPATGTFSYPTAHSVHKLQFYATWLHGILEGIKKPQSCSQLSWTETRLTMRKWLICVLFNTC